MIPLGWVGIIRLGLVQAALGAIVVLATSTMNRVMVVELGLPAILPGALIALHYAIQALRPRLGYGSDTGRRLTPWILGGMAVLTTGCVAAALATALLAIAFWPGLVLAVLAFAMIGLGVGASGTSLLVLLARRVAPSRRGPAATVVWVMMIAGIALTATVASHVLDPFTLPRLVAVASGVAIGAMALTLLAVWGVEGVPAQAQPTPTSTPAPFFRVLREIWAEPTARRFTIFVFVSMFAYSAQELIVEPFAGTVLAMTPGQSAGLAGLLHGGVMMGMILVAIATGAFGGALRNWAVAGCLGSAVAVLAVAAAGFVPNWPLRPSLFLLGVANGAFSVSAIGAMMGLAHAGSPGSVGGPSRAGTRMGLWGAAQALAFGLGGLCGSGASDIARRLLGSRDAAYAAVFTLEAALFLIAAVQAARLFAPPLRRTIMPPASLAPGD